MLDGSEHELLRQALDQLEISPERAGVVSTDEEIAAIEHAVGIALPADYRWFLLTYGRAYIGGVHSVILSVPGGRHGIFYFEGTRPERNLGSLLSMIANRADILEDNELPIAGDILGNLTVLNARTEEISFISTDDSTRTRSIAVSFTDLITRLEPEPEDDDE